MIAIPLISRQWVLGAIDIYMTTPTLCRQAPKDVLMAFAAQAAVAIDNAQQYLDTGDKRAANWKQRANAT